MEISENMARIDKEAIGENKGEIVVYQPDEITRLEVKIENESVWLTQEQIAILFGVKRPAITKHIRNIFDTNELEANSVCSILERTASDGKTYMTQFYNLDMILSVGYRVNSKNAVLFRRWASSILKEHLLKGYSISNRFSVLEKELKEHRQMLDDHEKKIDFFVRTSLPPVEGIFFDGQLLFRRRATSGLTTRPAKIWSFLRDDTAKLHFRGFFSDRPEKIA